MSFTLPSGTTASPRAKIRSAAWNAAFNSVAAALNLRRESTEIVPAQYGGWGVDVSGKSGVPHFDGGTPAWDTGTVLVDSFGAVGDGVTDDSAAIQAAIDSDIPHIVFNPLGVYLITAPSVIDALATGTSTLLGGRIVDGQGCRIVTSGTVANAFQITDQRHLQFRNFRFDGTYTGACVLFTANASWQNEFSQLRTCDTASATALLEVRNTSAESNPGMFRMFSLVGAQCKDTILLSKGAGALGVFDDFHIYDITGGDYQEDASAVRVSVGCNLSYSHIHDIMSGGPHAVNAEGGDIAKSVIERIYLEIPATSVENPTAYDDNWGVAGGISDSTIRDIWIYIANPTDHPGARCVYGNVYRSTIDRFGIFCFSLYDETYNPQAAPYTEWAYGELGSVNYPALHVIAGNNVTFNIPQAHVDHGVLLGTGVTHARYLGGVLQRYQNVDESAPDWSCRNAIFYNYGQGGSDCTITLPTADAGYDVRFVMMGDGGGDFHVKPQSGDKIILDGTALDDGDKITCTTPVVGNVVHLFTVRTSAVPGVWEHNWIAVTEGGTWVDGGA